jgi:hypothetical protein
MMMVSQDSRPIGRMEVCVQDKTNIQAEILGNYEDD